jgi:hypothetical protein
MCGEKERQPKSSGIKIIITSDKNDKRRKKKHHDICLPSSAK